MKRILLIILFLPLAISALQGSVQFFEEPELNGHIEEPVLKSFSIVDFFSGDFQQNVETYLQRFCGFQRTFVRINNQIRFSLFRNITTSEAVVGKNDVLFNQPGLVARQGLYAITQSAAYSMADSLFYIQEQLKKRGVKLIVAIAPNKIWFYENDIPEKFKKIKGASNEPTLSKALKERGVEFINFHSLFLDLHKKVGPPLMSKNGIHWSYYGAFLATDSLYKYLDYNGIHAQCGYTYRNRWSKHALSNADDYDVERSLNLLFDRPGEYLCYPKLTFYPRKKTKANSLLVISDSFYNQVTKNRILSNGFTDIDFYYYNKIHSFGKSRVEEPMSDSTFQEYLKSKKAIILMATESNLEELGWGAIETMYKGLR